MELFTYYRSTASYRVRLALAYKNIAYTSSFVNLRTNEQDQDYKSTNPHGLVPALQIDGEYIFQSIAILEYLERLHATPPLWLEDPLKQSQAMAIAQSICCDIHPLNNLRVLKYLTTLGLSEAQKNTWYHHWIHQGFSALEKQLDKTSGMFCIRDNVSIADICLIPQVYNANRFGVCLDSYPIIRRINQAVLAQEWATSAVPEAQADAI